MAGFGPAEPITFGYVDWPYKMTGAFSSASWKGSAAASASASKTITAPPLSFNLIGTTTGSIVPQSVRFTLNGSTYADNGKGDLLKDISTTTGVGTAAGTIDYAAGTVSVTNYAAGTGTVTLQSMLVNSAGANTGSYIIFHTPSAPIAPQSFILQGTFLDGTTFDTTAKADGTITATNVDGSIDISTGIVQVRFGSNDDSTPPVFRPVPVLFDTVKYSCVVESFLPLSAADLGLDSTRLPVDGRVPIFRNGDVAVIHNTKTEALAAPLAAGQQVTLSRKPISKLTLYDDSATPQVVDPANYTADLDAGTITFADPLDLSAYQQPLSAETRIEDMREVTDVQIQGQITLSQGVAFAYDTDSYVSSALRFGDLGAVVQNTFTQKTWTNVFQDTRIGDDSIAKYNDVLAPIVVDDANAITERWAIIFTGTTSFEVLGEFSGIIATGTTGADCAPINPMTNQPYFTIKQAGWGSGWVSNNVLRFDTVGAAHAFWIARSIQPGSATETQDSGRIEGRGDAN